MTSPAQYAKKILRSIAKDREFLERVDRYVRGDHDDPYMPDTAGPEYKLLARRAVSNWLPLVLGTPAQALYVDGYRYETGEDGDTDSTQDSAGWRHWLESRLDARQAAIYRGALQDGHAFVLTYKTRKGKVRSKGLSAMDTAAIYYDPANDDEPVAAGTVEYWASGEDDELSRMRMWDGLREYVVKFNGTDDIKSITKGKLHGNSECPVTRFAASIDLRGRTVGVIAPMIPLQDRINQTCFDLLVAQTYGSFRIRWVTGMAPPYKLDDEGNIVYDENGDPKYEAIEANAARFLMAEDPDTKFGDLAHTPLDGYIQSIEMSIKHLSAISQTPPHHLLGQIANISAEALIAAETALSRKVEEFRTGFGESWKRVFRLAAELNGDDSAYDDRTGQVVWRDVEARSLSQASDALGKLAEQLGVPKRALWPMIPGVTQTTVERWEAMADEDPDQQMAEALTRAGRTSAIPRAEAPEAA